MQVVLLALLCVRVVDLMVMMVMDWGTNNTREQEQECS